MSISAELQRLLDLMVQRKAADLILTEGQPPMLRLVGDLTPVPGAAVLTADTVRRVANELMTPVQQQAFERDLEMDLGFGLPGVARFRVNIFLQRGAPGIAIRMLSHEIPTMDSLGVPEVVRRWLEFPHGIIIVTGPTGAGKSTTQASMVGHLNGHKSYHMVTIEDPVEFTHPHGTCTIEQREVGRDTQSFAQALRHVFRQSPDVIMIGEMRDLETFETALQLAETGHLVLATLHTGDATQAISRIVDVFPAEQQQQARVQLSQVLIGVLVQQLIPRVDGEGRVLATEVLEATPALRNLIRKNELQQIYSTIQTGSAENMSTMNASLLRLFRDGVISLEQAMLFTARPKEFEQLVARETQPLARVLR